MHRDKEEAKRFAGDEEAAEQAERERFDRENQAAEKGQACGSRPPR
jgi:hypothetical protein